ncbi:flagellar hook-basal body complex protein FliE [bacterium]|nr:flagellar hook-basal body complex protein FliE [bacterium]
MNELITWQGSGNTLKQAKAATTQVAEGGVDFGATMKQHLQELRDVYNMSEGAQRQWQLGEMDTQTAVMLVNKADLALTYTMELRNKLLEAYQELSRMQV